MNKLFLYILLLFSLFPAPAQTIQDTVKTTRTAAPVADSVTYNHRTFDSSFKQKYTDDADFVYENKHKGKSQWERFKAWLRKLWDDLFTFRRGTQESSGVAIIVRLVALLILLFVVYLIVKAILNKEGMWIFGKAGKTISAQDITEKDISRMDFAQLIAETKASGDYRLGIRYYYLWLLKKLTEQNIIEWHRDKTNSEYLYEIKNNELRKDFEYLSYVYDYSWYGEFPVDDAAFGKAEKAFRKTLNTL